MERRPGKISKSKFQISKQNTLDLDDFRQFNSLSTPLVNNPASIHKS
jgi:hypothetical protein